MVMEWWSVLLGMVLGLFFTLSQLYCITVSIHQIIDPNLSLSPSLGWQGVAICIISDLFSLQNEPFLNVIINYLTGNESPGVMVEGQTFTIGEHGSNFIYMRFS